MVDTWQPGIETSTIDNAAIKQLALAVLQAESMENAIAGLSAGQKQQVASWLKQPAALWQPVFEDFNEDEQRALCELFTVGEMKISDWLCGAKNPTIILLRVMKQQNRYPEKDFIRKLKKLTDNRYIPYGDALG